MKFTNLVYDVIVEEIKNKSTIQYLYKKWLGDNPTEEQKNSVEDYIKFFGQKRDSLSLKQAAVKEFLAKHNDTNGDYFDPRNLKDITKYSLEQIKSLYQEFYVDDVNNNEYVKWFLNYWYGNDGQGPTEDEKFQGYKMLTWFNTIRPKLSLEIPEIQSFLFHYDGEHNSTYFDPQNIKDLKSYNLEQITDLFHEFNDPTQQMRREDETFNEGGGLTTEAKRRASEKIWKSDDNVVVNEEGLKVHYIPDQRTAIKYGYYQQQIRSEMYGYDLRKGEDIKAHWCVTGRGSSDSWTNLWGRYRSQGKTFYFVIDESKKPEEGQRASSGGNSRYYLGALQNYGRNGWVLTSLLNDNDTSMTWEQVISIYPQLAEHRDTLRSVEYDANVELNVDTSIVGRINENPGPLQFSKQSPSIKKAYIDEGHPLTKAHSWETLNAYLRNLYIARTEETNMYNSWSTLEILAACKRTPEFYQLLKNKIKSICDRTSQADIKGKGISILAYKILSNTYHIDRRSIDNENLLLVKKSEDEPTGIWDLDKEDWATFDGVRYRNEYTHIDVQLYREKEGGNTFVVNVYSKSDNIDPTSFFVLHAVHMQNEYGEAHFIGYNRFQELLQKIVPSDEAESEGFTDISDFNPETDVDMKEEDVHFT